MLSPHLWTPAFTFGYMWAHQLTSYRRNVQGNNWQLNILSNTDLGARNKESNWRTQWGGVLSHSRRRLDRRKPPGSHECTENNKKTPCFISAHHALLAHSCIYEIKPKSLQTSQYPRPTRARFVELLPPPLTSFPPSLTCWLMVACCSSNQVRLSRRRRFLQGGRMVSC